MTFAAGIALRRPRGRRGALRRLLLEPGGFGIVELLIALLVLNIGIFATIAAFNSGVLTLRRASRTATASSIAERQMELYRGLTFAAIVLSTPGAGDPAIDATHTGDPHWAGSMAMAPCPVGNPAEACKPVQNVSGADHRQYRVDTYLRQSVEQTSPPSPYTPRAVKVVDVVVRDGGTNKVLNRIESTFDQSTGA
jgi:hypothetical protein